MFKKFMAFFSAIVILVGAAGLLCFKYLVPPTYPVFVESFDHGVMTVDKDNTSGKDSKFMLNCKRGQTVTLNINPERTDSKYYNLSKLVVNGEDVTDEVNMLQYKFKVDKAMTVLAYFKKGKQPSQTQQETAITYDKEPYYIYPADNEYIGSEDAYDISEPTVIYDEKSGYYYCFASNNVVIKSKDLVDWNGRTTYFSSAKSDKTKTTMDLSAFSSVKKWAKDHGYDMSGSFVSETNNAQPKAPDIIKIGSTYFLYFSLCKEENSNESAIFCVKTTDLQHSIENNDWQDGGLVLSSCGYNKGSSKENKNKSFHDKANAVSPSVFTDKNGKLFMAYGAYYGTDEISGEIYLLELDKKSGLLKNGSEYNSKGETISTLHGEKRFNSGVLVAKPGSVPSLSKNQGSLISGVDVVYNGDNGYYYLFMTYGVDEANCNIRVARSKSVDGPYEDYNGESVAEFSSSKRKNQYTKGLTLIGGYNFARSSGGSVSYTDVGKASVSSPCIIKIENGNWIMASQSRLYYKAEDDIVTGEEIAQKLEISADTKPLLDVRQVFFSDDQWPMALSQRYTGENPKRKVKENKMYGNWDVLVFDGKTDSENYKAVERTVSQPLTIEKGVAISRDDIENERKISKLYFEKTGDYTYSILISGVKYEIYPTIAWDFELSEPTYVFTGIGEDGSTVWGKKNYSAFMEIYTDTYYYVLSQVDDETQEQYNEKLSKISNNPSQSAIDQMTKELIEKVQSQ